MPVGGGRTRPGFEIDHSERSSRVAISRAGRRPPAHTAAQPNKTSHAAAGPGWASRRHAEPIISTPGSTCVEGAGGTGGHGRASRRGAGGRRQGQGGLRGAAPNKVRSPSLAGGRALRRPEHPWGHKQHEAARPQGPGGSRVRPLGGHQRRVQRIWVPVAPRRSQASTTRAAMPASADLPHVRGSYCFFTPTSPSILRTPS